MDIKQIKELIKFVAESGVSEVELEQDDFKLTIKATHQQAVYTTQMQPQQMMVTVPQQMPTEAGAANREAEAKKTNGGGEAKPEGNGSEAVSGKTIEILSPMIGTFYRKPSPDKDVFIKVGDMVKKGQVVAVIEAMKLFNEIESEVEGKVVKVLAEDSSPVEYDQPLFLVEPA